MKPTRPDLPTKNLKGQTQVEKLRQKLEMLNAQNAVLRKTDENQRLQFVNGLGDLVRSAEFRQENITSWNPLIQNNQYANITLNFQVPMYMYSTHGVIQTAINQPVQDAHRDPIELESKELSYSNLGELEQWFEETAVHEPFCDSQDWARLFGGSAAILNLAGDPRKPLDLDNPRSLREIERGRFALYPAARWELGATWRYSDAYNFYGMEFDKTRVHTLIGKRMPWLIERQLSGWGASLIARMAEDFNMFLRGRNVLYELLQEAKVDVFKIAGYNSQLLTATGTDEVDRRIAMTNSLKSFHNALLLDSEDEYTQKQLHFTGVAEVMRENRMGLVACTRIPARILFSDTGDAKLSADSGEDAQETYNAMVKSEVRRPARPLMLWLLRLGTLAIFGKPYHIDFKYPALREMSAKNEEEVKTSQQNRLAQAQELGWMDEAEAAAAASRLKLFPVQTRLAQRGASKTGAVTKDVPARNWRDNKEQGAKHARRESGLGGDGRQFPRNG